MYVPVPAWDVFSLSENSSVPLMYDEVRLREAAVPVRLLTPLERAKPRDGDIEVAVDGEVRPVGDSVAPRYDVVARPVLDKSSIVSSVLRDRGSVPNSLNDDVE